jgi:hypothetical protein
MLLPGLLVPKPHAARRRGFQKGRKEIHKWRRGSASTTIVGDINFSL